ncbi:MAG TPA: preprotein translocase subunit YajC [Pseudomonadales bacterium]|nr:preprotein translocase subunit YajC [Pseudomonadales bacterium]
MSFLFAEAWAADAGASQGAGWLEFLPLVLLFVIFYFFLIRPQQKRAKEHTNLVAALAKGDEIVTSGGVVGTITRVEDEFVVCRVADGVELRFQKPAVIATLPKGTLKKLDAEKS